MEKIKAIVFDLDGVLVNTEYFNWKAWKKVLSNWGISFSKKDFMNYMGKQGRIIDNELRKKYKLKIPRGFLYQEKTRVVKEWILNEKIRTMPYAKRALSFFKKKNYLLAVATGSLQEEAKIKLKKIGLFSFFSVIVSGSEIKRGKPFPDVYLLACKKLGVLPRESLALEDTSAGVIAAKKAGLACFAIPNELSQKQDFSRADKIFSNLKEVINFFQHNVRPV